MAHRSDHKNEPRHEDSTQTIEHECTTSYVYNLQEEKVLIKSSYYANITQLWLLKYFGR